MSDQDAARTQSEDPPADDHSRTAQDERSPSVPDDRSASEQEPGAQLDADALVVGYPGTADPVIAGESLRVPPGEVTALVGPNGSGKSTLLKGLARQLAPDDGTVLLDGRAVDQFGTKELARKLGLLSQENAAPDGITVEDLVERGRYPHHGFFESATETDRAAVDDAVSLAGIEHLRDREVGSLSGGQKQLVWIAMTLAQETDVLLLDEPTTFLDPHHQLEVMQIVETLRDERETTVVLVLHDISQAARYADHVVALESGSVYARGPPEAVLTRDLLADVFDIEAEILETDHGLQIVPLNPIAEDGPSEGDAG